MKKRYVSYRRVSTSKQERSGLGLEAQATAVAKFIEQSNGELIRDFVETESGRQNDRMQLQAAIAFAQRSQATLLVAKLDRLSRNVAFLATLMESRVDFVAADNPHATPFTIHILASVAQWEREAISKRTKEAMAVAKAKGSKFGSARENHWLGLEANRLHGARAGGAKAAIINRQKAESAYRDVAAVIVQQRNSGASLQKIADSLNSEKIPTRRGKMWQPATIRLVLARFSDAGPFL